MSETGAPSDETTSSTPEQGGARPEQHGPEMDDTQVEATGELADTFEPARPQESDSSGGQGPS